MAATLKDIYQKHYSQFSEEAFMKIVSSDPTYDAVNRPDKMGRYGKWLLVMVGKGAIGMDELEGSTVFLDTFHRYKTLLEQKDITQYKSYDQLIEAVSPYITDDYKLNSKEARIRQIKANAEHVYMDDDWLIVVPHTWEAAKYYSKHTRWCTAFRENDSYFKQYNKQGPLYININRHTHEKWQFHFQTKTFCNAEDHSIDLEEMLDTMTEGVRMFYQSKGYITQSKHNWRTFNEAWAAWLADSCHPDVDFSRCEQSDNETFTPTAIPESVTSVSHLFDGCHHLKRIDLSLWNVGNIRDFRGMFRMCDHLEFVDLSGWNLQDEADLSSMFQYNAVKIIKMHGCQMQTVRKVWASTQEYSGLFRNLHLELTPGSPEDTAYRNLQIGIERFKQVARQDFISVPDLKQTLKYLQELALADRMLTENPVFTRVDTGTMSNVLANICCHVENVMKKYVPSPNFKTRKVGPFLLSRPDIDGYKEQLSAQFQNVSQALEIAVFMAGEWGTEFPETEEFLHQIRSRAASDTVSIKQLALQRFKALGFSDRTYVSVPWLMSRIEKWTGNIRNGTQHLRMTEEHFHVFLILSAILIPFICIIAFQPLLGIVTIIYAVVETFQKEKTKEAVKIAGFLILFMGSLTAVGYYVARPAILWLWEDRQPDKTEVMQIPIEQNAESLNQYHTLVVCGDTLSADYVLAARLDSVPFGRHVIRNGITIGEWCVSAMAKEHISKHPDYDRRTLSRIKDIINIRLEHMDETELRDFVSTNYVSLMVLMFGNSNDSSKKDTKTE